jgi:hypothetical protein
VTSRLGMNAFHTVLLRKPSAYHAIIRALAQEVKGRKHRHMASRFRTIVRDAPRLMGMLSF